MYNDRRNHRRRHRKMRRGMRRMMFGGIMGLLFMTGALMVLWNALIPVLFGGPVLSFFQALGLLVLSRMLFGGGSCRGGRCGHGPRGERWRRKFRERMEKMSPEERAKFKESFKGKGYEVNIFEVEEEVEVEEDDQDDEGQEGDDQQKKKK